MRPNEVVHRFLASIGRPEAASQYLQLFQAARKERFALVVIGPDVLQNAQNALIADLLFLQELDLSPVLCLQDKADLELLTEALPSAFPIGPCDLDQAADVAGRGLMPAIIAADRSARAEATLVLSPRKVVFLINQSGLQPAHESVRSLVNLRTDYQALLSPQGLPTEEAALLSEIKGLFDAAKHTFTVSVTSAHDFLRELFTLKGAGTLVRRGTAVQELSVYDQLDRSRMASLFHSAFQRELLDSFYQRPVLGIFLAPDYHGAAIIEAKEVAPYLSKFAVDLRAQGEGIGGDLWQALSSKHKRLFWRSRSNNPIANWYAGQCDGLVRESAWTVYWRGLRTDEIPAAVDEAMAAPIDFASSM